MPDDPQFQRALSSFDDVLARGPYTARTQESAVTITLPVLKDADPQRLIELMGKKDFDLEEREPIVGDKDCSEHMVFSLSEIEHGGYDFEFWLKNEYLGADIMAMVADDAIEIEHNIRDPYDRGL